MSNSQYARYVALTLTLLSLAIQAVTPSYSSTHVTRPSISTPPASEQPLPPILSEAAVGRVHSVLQNTPLSFVENRGQIDSRIAYYVQGGDTSVYFTPQGLTFRMTAKEGRDISLATGASSASRGFNFAADLEKCVKRSLNKRRWTARLDFVAANPHVKPIGKDPTPTVTSYFKGSKEDWKTGLASYEKLVYPDLWPGIDLVYKGSVNQLKYEFVVRPGADPNQIKLSYRGARVQLKRDGALEVKTPVDSFEDAKPYSYQMVEGERIEVATRYLLQSPNRTGKQRFGFRVSDYDTTKTLLIDPAIVVYAGYIGGALNDLATDIAVDSAGNAYVTGMSYSSESEGFPVRVGPDLNYNPHRASDGTIIGPEFDVFVAKVNADGTGLSYCGYIGGRESQAGLGIAVDGAGNAYVTGFTNSSQGTFPVTVGPSLTYSGSTSLIGDAFVAKVNASGTSLAYCGYIGGRIYDVGFDIAVDSAGNAYVTGQTGSLGPSQDRSGPFPAIVGPTLIQKFGFHNGFVAKVRADGTGLAYCGYIGGNRDDGGLGIAVDAAGSAYVTGYTNSQPEIPGSSPDFPAIVGPSVRRTCTDSDSCQNYDAFVAKVKPDGTGFVYCGYIGGARNDIGTRIAVDSAGNAYITGSTGSPQTSFPVTVGPDLTYNGDNGRGTLFGDAYVAKVKADGTGLVYCGYIGGAGGDVGYDIKVDSTGAAYISGNTTSTPATFPVTDGSSYSGGTLYGDAFVAKVRPDGTGLLFAGYFGGASEDAATGIALDNAGNVYICGGTFSPETSFPVAVGPSLRKNLQQDAFVAKIILDNTPPPPRPPIVTGATRQGKMLIVAGRNFDFGALIYINGEKQKKSANDDQNPTTIMIARKAGKFILPGDKVTVRNSDGTESNQVIFSG